MTRITSTECGGCGDPVTRPHRIHQGAPYCAICYPRCFKRKLCGGCGMFGRLFAADPNAVCPDCEQRKPCVRCKRTDFKLGRLTPYGPACDVCSPYFAEEKDCEECGESSTRRSRVPELYGDKLVCGKCARKVNSTCASCRRYRLCTESQNGLMRCELCATVGTIACSECGADMPAGKVTRCDDCYWRARCRLLASQLVELMSDATARAEFTEYAAWLPTITTPQKAAGQLQEHVEFFVKVAKMGADAWNAATLVERLGGGELRRYANVARWLQEVRGMVFTVEDKVRASEALRVQAALSELPPGSPARELVQLFLDDMVQRKPPDGPPARTLRMALRPAVDLCLAQNAQGRELPTQAALAAYLQRAPGQRAAASNFLGFLRRTRGLDLKLPDKREVLLAQRRALEARIATLVAEGPQSKDWEPQWLSLAMQYFHLVPASKAKALLGSADLAVQEQGYLVTHEGAEYWLPHPWANSSSGPGPA